ncbi:MAG: LUD domain-containing protein [Fusobacterium sp.]|nr:LUD domain-containing protein [Fusobacterium sp.]
MEENLRWYKEKKLDRLCEVLLDKGYLIHRVFSVKDAQEKILSLLNKEQTLALGDSWELMSNEFVEKLKEFKFYDRFGENSEKVKRESLLAEMAILEGEFITEDGQVLVVGDYNTSSALFGAENIILLLSENKIVKDLNSGFSKISEYERYYKMRAEKLKNINDGLSIGIIENGKKFSKRITIVLTTEDTGL